VVLSNAATSEGYARMIRAACEAAGVTLEIVGGTAGNAWSTPETMLPAYDLAFAKGRSALEALAVGCATVLADRAGAGPLVTPDNYEVLRRRNFGIRELRHPHDVAWYATQIARYRGDEAALVSARVRAEAAMEPAVDRLLDIYAAAMTTPAGTGDASRAAALHCCRIARPLKQAHDVGVRAEALAAELQLARAEIDARSRASSLLEESARECDRVLTSTRAQVRALQQEVEAFKALPTLRLRDAVVKTPVVGPVIQAGVRRLTKLLG
jgi:hypothetical protein